jgi:hypothetical protein
VHCQSESSNLSEFFKMFPSRCLILNLV